MTHKVVASCNWVGFEQISGSISGGWLKEKLTGLIEVKSLEGQVRQSEIHCFSSELLEQLKLFNYNKLN